MPEISRFFGIAIAMPPAWEDPPRFQALMAQHCVTIHIETGAVEGRFPPRALGLVLEWRERHLEDLRRNWTSARQEQRLRPIAPLE